MTTPFFSQLHTLFILQNHRISSSFSPSFSGEVVKTCFINRSVPDFTNMHQNPTLSKILESCFTQMYKNPVLHRAHSYREEFQGCFFSFMHSNHALTLYSECQGQNDTWSLRDNTSLHKKFLQEISISGAPTVSPFKLFSARSFPLKYTHINFSHI